MGYRVSGGADNSAFTMDDDGNPSFITARYYEDQQTYQVQVEVEFSDGEKTDIQLLTVNVTQVNDNAPVITNRSSCPYG